MRSPRKIRVDLYRRTPLPYRIAHGTSFRVVPSTERGTVPYRLAKRGTIPYRLAQRGTIPYRLPNKGAIPHGPLQIRNTIPSTVRGTIPLSREVYSYRILTIPHHGCIDQHLTPLTILLPLLLLLNAKLKEGSFLPTRRPNRRRSSWLTSCPCQRLSRTPRTACAPSSSHGSRTSSTLPAPIGSRPVIKTDTGRGGRIGWGRLDGVEGEVLFTGNHS